MGFQPWRRIGNDGAHIPLHSPAHGRLFRITLGYILVTGAGAGVGYGIGGFGDEGVRASTTMWGGFVGFGIFGAVMYWAREYILYIVKAGHIAVLIQLIDGKRCRKGAARSRMPRP
ncbi:hypothetical protein [Qingshengfaniella alkalisoli]|uniref:hypothetical protein n=1 Tax=Qingshengfaniella alkalisoli TaxID=2599296 RepID=UPI001F1078B2|nr:hypothetical protein [Qingshengfaniella alkalisoli]